ncbi:23S rRNA (adenine(1618)-N(6))-methyltransferase RlmF [Mucilaginibacter galii]|uniref:Ribosomal RNA large subunit methyltransferase F n=1 Tax=Mucilaginibacter galii TaxID=2005073 RepID=A0A917JAQ0_9SPHI|nr:23S rRNA (adenine(1618)-N(6))-methyltransferase RlmF [Mucilaginibacter galii]GGI50249.1 ribosomal RNA large subunit methyltransferase F [Mucilaginibacter galii]
MPVNPKLVPEEKIQLHQRNRHKGLYNFPELIKSSPQLASFVSMNQYNNLSIDFKDADAVKALNKALLKHFYGVELWDIPEGYLCPPIPGRADYLHYVADLLAQSNSSLPRGKTVKVLDVGVGANCIYPLIGHHEYGWNFVGADIDALAVRSAMNIVEANGLGKYISIRKQNAKTQFFKGIINAGEKFSLTICNPPFHASLQEAVAGTERKWKNLGHQQKADATLNFGGRQNELWCAGGEEGFVRNMIEESKTFATSVLWFTSLISKKESLPGCYHALKQANAAQVQTINMAQGQKVSRLLAWSFMDEAAQQQWWK